MFNCLHMEGKGLLYVGQECREQSNCSLAVMSWQMLQQLCSAGQGGLGRRLQLAKLDMGPSHWAWVVFPASYPTLVTATNNQTPGLHHKKVQQLVTKEKVLIPHMIWQCFLH